MPWFALLAITASSDGGEAASVETGPGLQHPIVVVHYTTYRRPVRSIDRARSTRNLRVPVRLKMHQSTRVSEFAIGLVSVRGAPSDYSKYSKFSLIYIRAPPRQLHACRRRQENPMRSISRTTFARAYLAITFFSVSAGIAAEPVALRVESFTVLPSTGPLAFVEVENRQPDPYRGMIALKPPEGWRIVPAEREVVLAEKETKRISFAIELGRNAALNSYAVEVTATAGDTKVVRQQNVACASAPYFKPTIDGNPDEWKDAIGVRFTEGGKRTELRTYWNRRSFSLLVAVEEDTLIGQRRSGAFDGVQLAISPADSRTATSPDKVADRYEFLLAWTGQGTAGKCFRLAAPETQLATTQNNRDLSSLQYDDATVAVTRTDGVTYYECSIPFKPMRDRIRPSEGREFFLSVLVHDPDGTGIRDWGKTAGLWPWQRNRLAWSKWPGAKWGKQPPYDNKLHWGLCASKY